jgi:hypothetical protein
LDRYKNPRQYLCSLCSSQKAVCLVEPKQLKAQRTHLEGWILYVLLPHN